MVIFLTMLLEEMADILLALEEPRDELEVDVSSFAAGAVTEEPPLALDVLLDEEAGLEAAAEVTDWFTTFGSVDGMGLPSLVCSFTTFWCFAPRMWAAYASAPVQETSQSSQRSWFWVPRIAVLLLVVFCEAFKAASFFLCFCPSKCSL